MKWMIAVPLLLLTAGCHNFANRFASVEKVCGTSRAPDTHYLELHTSQGKRLSLGDVIVATSDGTELSDRFTDKGCLVVSDKGEQPTLILRHRLLSEGLILDTAALKNETTISQRSFSAYRYQPPTLQCRDSMIMNGGSVPLFTPPTGILPEAYKTLVNGASGSPTLDIKDWADGNYTIAGQVIELFSPEQRRYDFSCAVTIDRTAPQFTMIKALRGPGERVAAPGEALTFPVDPQEQDVTLSVCIEKEGAPCVFQDLSDGKWIAPERGEYTLKVVAKDKAGNESIPLPVSLRIFDATRIAGIQSEIEVIRRLVSEQKGGNARSRMADVVASYKNLGTVQEKQVVQKAIEETQFAVHASPDQYAFPKEGSFLGWISGENSQLLVFQKDASLIVKDEIGFEVKRWTLPGTAKVSIKPCVEGSYQELLVKSGTNVLRLKADAFDSLGALKWDNIQTTGICRYRKYRATSTVPWTLMDLDRLTNQPMDAQDFWLLKSAKGDLLLLTKTAQGYFTQKFEGSDTPTLQPILEGLLVEKVMPDGRLIVKEISTTTITHISVMHWTGESFVSELQGLEVNPADSAGNKIGNNKTLYRDLELTKLQWFLLDGSLPDMAQGVYLPTATAPEKIQFGDDIIVTDSATINGAIDLAVYDSKGNLLSLLRFDDLGPSSVFKTVMGNKLILETADDIVVLNPFPHTQLGLTRNNTLNGAQWGAAGIRYVRSILTAKGSWLYETFTAFGQTWGHHEPGKLNAVPRRSLEKPFAVDGDRAAFVSNKSNIVLVRKDGSSETMSALVADEIVRLDFAADGQALLLTTRKQGILRKSLTEAEAPVTPVLASIWPNCEDEGKRMALDFDRTTEAFVTIACGQVTRINLQGQAQTIEPSADKDWVDLQSSADGQGLLVVSKQAAYLNGTTIRPSLVNDPLNYGRMNEARSHVVLTSTSGRLFLARVRDGQIWEIRLAKFRPISIDAVSFDDNKHTFSLIAPEGILEFPADPETFMKE